MTDKKKKSILFVNDEMQMGGVARVLNSLMRALPEDLYDIDLLILHKEGMLLDEIPQHVHVIEGTEFFWPVDQRLCDLVEKKDAKGVLRKVRLLTYMKTGAIQKKIAKERKKILHKQYDVEVAAKEGFCTIFTAYGDSKRKINWVLTDYSVCNYSRNHMPLVKKALSRIDLNIADSEQAAIAYKTVFKVRNCITIHNLMDTERIQRSLKEDAGSVICGTDGPNVVTVARFDPQKALDRMLNASHAAYEKGLHHTLYLIGGGVLEPQLRAQVEQLGMKHVVFLGYMSNPYGAMKKADLFALSSLYEGFATVISESLIAGTPVLTTDVSGCQEQIRNAGEGWITENTQEAFTEGFIFALSDAARLKEMKEGLQEYRYPNAEILEQFLEVL